MKLKSVKNNQIKYLFLSCFVCLLIRLFIFFILHILYEDSNKYIKKLYYIDNLYFENDTSNIKELNYKLNELENYYKEDKRNTKQNSFFLKNDILYFSFNSDIFNLKYLYDSYILNKLNKKMYYSLTVRINPFLLKFLHFYLFKKINKKFSFILNCSEFRYYILISIIDILIGILLYLIVEKIKLNNLYFINEDANENNLNEKQFNEEKTEMLLNKNKQLISNKNEINMRSNQIKEINNENISNKIKKNNLINSILLVNIYLNNPLTILSNSFLSFDNFKLLIICLSVFLSLKRINKFSNKFYSYFNLSLIIFLNSILIYVSSFHFVLVLFGINNFIIYQNKFIKKIKINENIKLHIYLRIILINIFLLIITFTLYIFLLLLSAYENSNSLFFLNNTLINEYKILFTLPNLGNFWYIFSLMFKEYYSTFLFLFHFHIFFYPIPLLFRLIKTPIVYLKVLIMIVLLFHPNLTLNDIIFSLLLISIDYKHTFASIPIGKILLIFLCSLSLYYVSLNLWLKKNTGNANYPYFYQLILFNTIVFIMINSIKYYIYIQTPAYQLKEGYNIIISKNEKKQNVILNIFKNFFS